MPDVLSKCTVCGALLDEEDLFCPNCGTEAPTLAHSPTVSVGSASANSPATHLSTCNFTCRGCGASMSYDASAQALRCPFCGSEQLEKQPDAKEISPDGVVPFVVTRDQAEQTMRRWLGQGFWRPGDLADAAAVVKMTPVYVPYWVFQAETHTYWTADTNQTPPGAMANWYPVSGQHEGQYSGLLVGASGALTGAETGSLCPFDLSAAAPPEKIDLQNSIFERFTVPRKYARPLASQGLESLESQACEEFVPGKCRNLNVNVRITNLASRPLLVPVWIMAYRYRDQVFRFLANGQTGKSAGQAPISYRKITAAAAIAAVVILLILLWLFAVGGGFRHREGRWSRNAFSESIDFCYIGDLPLNTRTDTGIQRSNARADSSSCCRGPFRCGAG
jgi:predicted RNA-binding Zn-ribbon protein involved in translation (DUF1610 family)